MANDLWRTPPEIFSFFNKKYRFRSDVCASKENALCKDYITEENDFLEIDSIFYASSGDYCWINPPYSKPKPFIERALKVSKERGIGFVFLLNVDFSTKWGELLASHQVTNFIITGKRLAFLDSNGLPKDQNSKGQFACVIPPYVRTGEPLTKFINYQTIMGNL